MKSALRKLFSAATFLFLVDAINQLPPPVESINRMTGRSSSAFCPMLTPGEGGGVMILAECKSLNETDFFLYGVVWH